MFRGVRRRLVLSYTAIFGALLLLLGPVLYVSVTRQIEQAADATLRLAAQRQAALALAPTEETLGISNRFRAPPTLAQRDTLYLLLDPQGRVRSNPSGVRAPGLPDVSAARRAARDRAGVFSTLVAPDATYRLFSVPLLHGGRTVAVLQAGHSLAAVASAEQDLLLFLMALGALAVVGAIVGGFALTHQAMRPIQAAFAAQRAFVADASHELRAPVTVVRSNAEVLLEAGAVAEPEDREMLEDIVSASVRMGRIIGDLLLLARLDAGTLPLEPTTVDLEGVVRQSCRQMSALAASVQVSLAVAGAQTVVVHGDASRLEQVLVILLDNAIRYNREGGRVEVRLRREGVQALVEVCDTGCGIPAAELPHLFSRFHRGQSAGQASQGSGLGLSIARSIAAAHRGHLSAVSVPGQGSTFTLALPALLPPPRSRQVPTVDASTRDGYRS